MVTLGLGFPGGSDSQESACNAEDLGSIPGSGRYPGEGNGNSPQYSCLKNSLDRGAWQARVCGGHKELNMTEQLTQAQNVLSIFSLWRSVRELHIGKKGSDGKASVASGFKKTRLAEKWSVTGSVSKVVETRKGTESWDLKGVGWTWQVRVQGAVHSAKNHHRPRITASAMQEEKVVGLRGTPHPGSHRKSHCWDLSLAVRLCVPSSCPPSLNCSRACNCKGIEDF